MKETETCVFGKQHTLQLKGRRLLQVQSFKYLGSVVTQDERMAKVLANRKVVDIYSGSNSSLKNPKILQ